MKTTVFFSSTVAILFSSILFLAGCAGLLTSANPAQPSSSAHGTFVYVRNDNSLTGTDGTISGFRMNADGTLTALQGSPFPINGNLAVSGNFLLVADRGGMTSYRIDPMSGSLTPAAHTAEGANSRNGLEVGPIAVDSRNVYRGSDASIYGLHVDDRGAFTVIPGSPFFIGGVVVTGIGVRHSTLWANFTDLKPEMSAYTIQNDGSLGGGHGPLGGGHVVDGSAENPAIHPNGKIAYTVGFDIESFTMDANGMLAQGSSTPPSNPENGFRAGAIDPTGKFLAAIDNTVQGIMESHISVFSIDPVTGNLTQLVAPVSMGVPSGSSITFDPSGRFILITHDGGTFSPNDVMVFSFDPASATVTRIQSAPTGMFPRGIVIATF
jgi:6-phosphogluconolactonase (cycloisomerase 2 family)